MPGDGPWRGYPRGDGSWTVGCEDSDGTWHEQDVAANGQEALQKVMRLRGIDKESRRVS